jgi:hypothetical protein
LASKRPEPADRRSARVFVMVPKVGANRIGIRDGSRCIGISAA